MITYNNINANEGGLSVRAKINNMFSALISGKEGVNEVWKSITLLLNGLSTTDSELDDVYAELKEQILRSFDYTDISIEDMRTYINGMDGGISGFAIDTDYDPDFPEDKAATVLGVGKGTYINMLDSTGAPITITDEDALVVFYKGANSTYWQYKLVYARAVINRGVIDGGRADTKYGGINTIDCGHANLEDS